MKINRRSFLKVTGLAGIGVILGQSVLSILPKGDIISKNIIPKKTFPNSSPLTSDSFNRLLDERLRKVAIDMEKTLPKIW